MHFKNVFMICVIFSIRAEVEGFASWCDANRTLFVTQGSEVTIRQSHPSDYLRYIFLNRRAPVQTSLAYARKLNDNNLTVYYQDHLYTNRTKIVGQQYNESHLEIMITISDITMKDNGTYTTMINFDGHYCWTLFVMQMNQEPRSAIEEGKPLYIYAHPHASLITRPLVNATMVWLLDGFSANQTGNFILQDGYIWIAHLRRDMFARNITYRVVQDNGDVNDANMTLNFTYGPIPPLTLVPEKKHYYLTSGDMIPDIICTTDCYPSCSISWGKHSPGSTLSLGKVTRDNTGEYTCTAVRNGVETVVKETVNIYVADNTSTTIAIAVLASVQAITTLALAVCAFCFYVRNKEKLCQQCFKTRPSPGNAGDVPKKSMDRKKRSGIELDHYEDLNIETRQTTPNTPYGQVNLAMPGNIVRSELEMYENTKIA